MKYIKYNGSGDLVENTCEYIKGRALNNWKPDSRNLFGGSSPYWVSYTCTNRFIAASLVFFFFFLRFAGHHHYAFHYFIVWFRAKWTRSTTGRVHPANRHILGAREGEEEGEGGVYKWPHFYCYLHIR